MIKKPPHKEHPQGKLMIRTMAMPANTNINGDIFGGWVVSHMDLAAASIARATAQSRITTVAIDSMVFISPVKVGDFVCCYAELLKVGCSSMVIRVETWVVRGDDGSQQQVTEGVFTFVAIDETGKPQPVNR